MLDQTKKGDPNVRPPLLIKAVSLGSSTNTSSTYDDHFHPLESPDSMNSLTHIFHDFMKHELSPDGMNEKLSNGDIITITGYDGDDNELHNSGPHLTNFPDKKYNVIENDDDDGDENNVYTEAFTSWKNESMTSSNYVSPEKEKCDDVGDDNIDWTPFPFTNIEVHTLKENDDDNLDMESLWGDNDDMDREIPNTTTSSDERVDGRDDNNNDHDKSRDDEQERDRSDNAVELTSFPFLNVEHNDDEKETNKAIITSWKNDVIMSSPLTLSSSHHMEEERELLIHDLTSPTNHCGRYTNKKSKPFQWIPEINIHPLNAVIKNLKAETVLTPSIHGRGQRYQNLSSVKHNSTSHLKSERSFETHELKISNVVKDESENLKTAQNVSCQGSNVDPLKTRITNSSKNDSFIFSTTEEKAISDMATSTSDTTIENCTNHNTSSSPPSNSSATPANIHTSTTSTRTREHNQSEPESMIFPCCQKTDDNSNQNAKDQYYHDNTIIAASSTLSESTNESKSTKNNVRQANEDCSKEIFSSHPKLTPSKEARAKAQQRMASKPKTSSSFLSIRFGNALTNIRGNSGRLRQTEHPPPPTQSFTPPKRRSQRNRKRLGKSRHTDTSSPPKNSKEYQDLVHRIQQKHEQYLKGLETFSPRGDSFRGDAKSEAMNQTVLKHQAVHPGQPYRQKHNNHERASLNSGKKLKIHVSRRQLSKDQRQRKTHDNDDDSSIASCSDSISSYKSMMHRANHQSYLPWQVSQYPMSGDDDCSSVASNASSNSLSSHFTPDKRDTNQPQPYHGYSSSGTHDDDSSFYTVSSVNSSYHIYSQSESGYLSDSVSIISDADPLAKPSKRVPKSIAKGDGDVWVEKTYKSKRTGEKRTYFVSVQTGKRTRDEPPTGASKVIYKDTRYVTNLSIVPVPPIVSFET